jgi:peptide-methionine (S)-S-oxide reductase
VSYEELLRVFWEGHDPTQGMRQGNDVGTQYRSAAYWDGEDQEAALLASRDRYQAALTAAGYQGGFTPNPTYEETCTARTGHTETVLVAYDPAKVSAEQLLRVFWEHHDPTQGFRQGNDVGTQYRSAVYWTTPEQEAAYRSTRAAYQAELTARRFGDITTEGLPASEAGPFYYAEEHHQQYLHKVPWGYCPDHGTGVSCPIGLGVKAQS